eukprot:15450136-Alexandrium_andersonii.AAC.1
MEHATQQACSKAMSAELSACVHVMCIGCLGRDGPTVRSCGRRCFRVQGFAEGARVPDRS